MDYAIIVAGGKGLRMGSDTPKQFLPVGGTPVLMHTIRRFKEYSGEVAVILVLPHSQQEHWRALCRKHGFDVEHTVVDGGDTRFMSSKNGLAAIPQDADGVVAIHDGVRPFVSTDVIARCYEAARKYGAAIPVTPVTDTLRLVADTEKPHNVRRADYRAVQTPQAFDIAVTRKAFDTDDNELFTDDASVAEAAGYSVTMVDGNRENIKITTPFDLLVAETIIKQLHADGKHTAAEGGHTNP